MAVIGIDLGGTKLAGAVFSSEGNVLRKETVHLAGRQGNEVGMAVMDLAARLKSEAPDLTALGVAVPGISYARTGEVWAPNIPGWEDYPLLHELRTIFPDPALPVTIESDRACAILGEAWQGAARGCTDAIFLTVGTGIGAGILADGRVLRGSHDIAGAVGWMALSRPFREPYTRCGCFEHHASGDGIARVARELLARESTYQGTLRANDPLSVTALTIFEIYPSGDPVAVEVVHQAVAYWGMAVANLVSLFNPQKIIFGGGVFGPAVQFIPQIREEAQKWAQPISMKNVALEPSRLGADAVLIGAASLALKSTGSPQ
jgi:glucokinase